VGVASGEVAAGASAPDAGAPAHSINTQASIPARVVIEIGRFKFIKKPGLFA
jgi:hypothetical protein